MRGETESPVLLREVRDEDLEVFFEHQRDPEAMRLAAMPARDRDAFREHWARIRNDERVTIRTVVRDGAPVGNVLSFERSGKREVGYWIGREFWGKGLATRSLAAFLDVDRARPLYARVAKHNLASQRVLQKCGFSPIEGDGAGPDDGVEEVLLELR